jgi:hypothetical protein
MASSRLEKVGTIYSRLVQFSNMYYVGKRVHGVNEIICSLISLCQVQSSTFIAILYSDWCL